MKVDTGRFESDCSEIHSDSDLSFISRSNCIFALMEDSDSAVSSISRSNCIFAQSVDDSQVLRFAL